MSSLCNWFFPAGSPTKILNSFICSPTHATSLTHLLLLYLNDDDDDDDDHHDHDHDNENKTMVFDVVMMIQTMDIQCIWDENM
jgi:hypothetical protein